MKKEVYAYIIEGEGKTHITITKIPRKGSVVKIYTDGKELTREEGRELIKDYLKEEHDLLKSLVKKILPVYAVAGAALGFTYAATKPPLEYFLNPKNVLSALKNAFTAPEPKTLYPEPQGHWQTVIEAPVETIGLPPLKEGLKYTLSGLIIALFFPLHAWRKSKKIKNSIKELEKGLIKVEVVKNGENSKQ